MAEQPDREMSAGALAMFERLLRRTHLSGAAELGAAVAEEARAIGAEEVVLYVVDYEQTALVPVPAPDAAGRERLPIQGTLAGRAFKTTSIVRADGPGGEGRRLWLPLLDGTERIGVMDMALSFYPDDPGVALCERYAHLAAVLIVTKTAYSDFFERLRRIRPMTGASELLWTVTPPMVVATNAFVLSAMLEPAYDMGGDAFDYALNGDTLHFAVFDAMGHGLAAAGVAAFAVSTYRNSRRNRLGLTDTYAAIDDAIAEQYPTSRFVTAVLAELDVVAGRLRWISAGHPAPLLLRDTRYVKTLEVAPAPPAGMRLATRPPTEGQESLEPGDRVLLYTDGITESRRPGGELFSVERLGQFIEREAASGQAAPETLRRLREAIIGREEGSLRDDATALLVEWSPGKAQQLMPETV